MKTQFLLILNFIAAFAIAQTQMRYLPMQKEYIDFGQAGTSSTPVTLPKDPDPNSLFGYHGAKPSFCQQIVYDRNSNNNQILFFIQDNQIYNKYGKAMRNILDDQTFIPACLIHSYIYFDLPDFLENENDANPILKDGCDLQIGVQTTDALLSQEVLVSPVPGSCYEFFMIYSIYQISGGDGNNNVDIFLRKIRYIDEDNVELSKIFSLGSYIPNISDPDAGISINIAQSPYRPATYDYILAVSASKELYTFNLHGSTDFENPSTNISLISDTTLCLNCDASEENFKEEAEMVPMYSHGQLYKYRVAYSFKDYTNDKIRFYITELSSGGSIANSYYFTELATIYGNGQTPKGLEFSPNGNYLYYTWTGQDSLRYINIPSLISGYPVTTYRKTISIGSDSSSYYKLSHIELGRDGKLYYIRSTGDGSSDVGTLTSFSNPNSPSTGTWAYSSPLVDSLKMQNYISPSIIPDINIRYCYEHYAIADQFDGSNYENYYSTISSECCLDHFAYNLLNTSFNSNIVKKDETSEDDYDIEVKNGYSGTWTATSNPFNTGGGNTVYLKRSLYVDAGATLTINGLTIKFQEGEGMYLLPGSGTTKGARVVLTNTKLTAMDACSNDVMWLGVSVAGNGVNQFPLSSSNTQTKLIMGGNSIIEYAEVGVSTNAGGIIQANGVTFRDNIYALDFAHFKNTGSYVEQSASYFTSCYFTTDDDLYNLKSRTPIYFVNMWENNGIIFTTCQFKNTTTVASHAFGTRGCGIIATGSNLITRGICGSSTVPCPYTDQTPTLFQSLDWAFKARIGTSIEAQKCKFDGNFKGLYIEDYNGNVKVLENYFNTANYTAANDTTYALYMWACPLFGIKENEFENGLAGIFINNCKGTTNIDNYVHRNTFNNLNYSTQSTGIIALHQNNDYLVNDGSGLYGTLFKCNTFTTNYYNIAVIGDAIAPANVKMIQGHGCIQDTCPANNWFNHWNCSYNLYSDFYVANTDMPYLTYYLPRNATYNYLLQCYSNGVNPTSLNTPNNSDKCPSHLISGGGGTSSSSSMIAQYNSMLSIDDQLEAKENELSALNLTESSDFINEKKMEIMDLHVKRGEILKNLLGNALTSTVPEAMDTLCAILQNEKGYNEKLILIRLFTDMNRINDAENVINYLRSDLDESASEFNNEINQALDVYEMMLQNSKNNHNMDSLKNLIIAHKELLQKIDKKPTHYANALAHRLLVIAGLKGDKEFILLPEPREDTKEKRFKTTTSISGSMVNIYPVPATNELFIESNAEMNGNIVIYDNLSRPLKQINCSASKYVKVDISSLSGGSYYLKIGNQFYKFIKTE